MHIRNMCMYTYVCASICMYIYSDIHTYAHICMYTMYVYIHIHIYVYMHTCKYRDTPVNVSVHIAIYVPSI